MLYSPDYRQSPIQAQLTQLDHNKTNMIQAQLTQLGNSKSQYRLILTSFKQLKRKHALQEAQQLLSAPLCTWCVCVLLQEVLMRRHLLLPDI